VVVVLLVVLVVLVVDDVVLLVDEVVLVVVFDVPEVVVVVLSSSFSRSLTRLVIALVRASDTASSIPSHPAAPNTMVVTIIKEIITDTIFFITVFPIL
jgi:hypothetical protein